MLPAVIAGFELNGLGVARSLAPHGIPCIGISGPVPNPAWATSKAQVIRAPEWSEPGLVNVLLDVGKRLSVRAPLLITKDEAVLWVSAHREELAEYYLFLLPPPNVVDLLMSKSLFQERALQRGWPVPFTCNVESSADVEAIRSSVKFPCILKARVKNSAFREFTPSRAFVCNDFDELVRAYNTMQQWEREGVVQEFIEGGDDAIAFCLTFADQDTNLLASFAGQKLWQFPPRFGITAAAAPAPERWREKLIGLTEAIWKDVGFCGLGSVEYKRRPRSDDFVIMEPTVGRTNYQNELAVMNGVNIPFVAYEFLSKGTRIAQTQSRTAVAFVDAVPMVRSVYRSTGSRPRAIVEWLRFALRPHRYTVFRWSDPKPSFLVLRMRTRETLGHIAAALLGKEKKQRLVTLVRGKGAPRD
jgi:D-aspartate ligase